MPCYHPITAWYGEKTASGKRRLTFSPNGGHGSPIEINCGQCIGCRLERARQWSVRIMHEAQFYEESAFLTLTYSSEHLPPSGSLEVRDLQCFFKRYRQWLVRHASRDSARRVRFFACGEYGDQLARPHYHAIVFGHSFLEDRKRWKQGTAGDQIYVSAQLDKLWGLGDCYIGNVSLSSAGYVARYTVKKVRGDRAEAHYQGKRPEFMVCSKGIGKRFFERYGEETYRDDTVVFKGREMAVPSYYDRLMEKQDPELLQQIKLARVKRAKAHWRNQTPDRLAVREEVTKARISTLKRS